MARELVLRSLAARDHTRAELSRKLAARHVPGETVDTVLDRFSELGLINDQAFAQRWVESRQHRRGLSRRALERELAAKGVDRAVAVGTTASIRREDEVVVAVELARRKARALHGLPAEVRVRRLAGLLSRRGFDASVIAEVVREVLNDDAGEGCSDSLSVDFTDS